MSIRGTLVLAGLAALAGYGCAHKYDENRRPADVQPGMGVPQDITPSTTPRDLQGDPQQQGTGGAGPSSLTPTSDPSATSPSDTDVNIQSESSSSSDVSGQFQGTQPGSSMTLPDQSGQFQGGQAMPATPTVPESKMNPGIGGSGTYDPAQDAKNCDRSQIGSPNSAGVDCDPLQGSDSTLPGTSGTGGSGLTGDTSKSFDDKKLEEKKKDKAGTGGSGLTEEEKAKKKAKKHKKHLDESTKTTEGSTQSTEGTGGSGTSTSIPADDKVQDEKARQDDKDYQELDKQVP